MHFRRKVCGWSQHVPQRGEQIQVGAFAKAAER